jgi:hypothetical protein
MKIDALHRLRSRRGFLLDRITERCYSTGLEVEIDILKFCSIERLGSGNSWED